ncbi:ATP-dependent protease LonB [Anaerosinus massiliensis]|uniref:ATP-dependent protease LonB n=1 Tax=Massilibacillus massiliensis TaxID=1806837 RepID=UPI000A9145F0|nr:ATP-dependent protease LonB [Massilibacillus massiliensis]
MDYAMNAITFIQLFFVIVIGLYFFSLLKSQQGNKTAIHREAKKEMDKLQKLRDISLTEPLSEKTRPSHFYEIIGQDEGIKALRAALCGANPQHVIIYGPPGVGKTAAARLVLEEAKCYTTSPFARDAKFIELDATTARFDERGIADPLIGTVHDPIYQGAGALGIAGVPQPKAGAVTKAHGGILFIDEIGELHSIQMNKLLKVLEDRKVFLESSYYNSEDTNIPNYIHDIFQNGLPADFRLVAATTRLPQEIPAAIRSRCVEIFFRQLLPDEVGVIARNAFQKIASDFEESAIEVIEKYAMNGRDAVNIVQIATGAAINESSKVVRAADVEWVVNFGQYNPRCDKKIASKPQIGFVNGLAVYGANLGAVMEVEACAVENQFGNGTLVVTGVVEEEEIASPGHTIHRKSMAKESVENVITVLANQYGIQFKNYNIHVNFPSAGPVDGPSAGVSIAIAIYSAIHKIPINNTIAMTGEISIRGLIHPVGGVCAKISAAKQAGAQKVLIPKANMQMLYENYGIEVIGIETLDEAIQLASISSTMQEGVKSKVPQNDLLTAASATVHM